jgi:D-tyrosyl-tRNA(Tyr) deacylase
MRALLQRVSRATVSVEDEQLGAIGPGLLIFVAAGKNDDAQTAIALAKKAADLRIFPDDQGKTNLSLLDTGGSALVISQFTLYADCRRGRRPSFSDAADPIPAETLVEQSVSPWKTGIPPPQGFRRRHARVFGQRGPFTIILDSEVLPRQRVTATAKSRDMSRHHVTRLLITTPILSAAVTRRLSRAYVQAAHEAVCSLSASQTTYPFCLSLTQSVHGRERPERVRPEVEASKRCIPASCCWASSGLPAGDRRPSSGDAGGTSFDYVIVQSTSWRLAFDDPRGLEEYDHRDIDQAWIDYLELVGDRRIGALHHPGHLDLLKKFGYRLRALSIAS